MNHIYFYTFLSKLTFHFLCHYSTCCPTILHFAIHSCREVRNNTREPAKSAPQPIHSAPAHYVLVKGVQNDNRIQHNTLIKLHYSSKNTPGKHTEKTKHTHTQINKPTNHHHHHQTEYTKLHSNSLLHLEHILSFRESSSERSWNRFSRGTGHGTKLSGVQEVFGLILG